MSKQVSVLKNWKNFFQIWFTSESKLKKIEDSSIDFQLSESHANHLVKFHFYDFCFVSIFPSNLVNKLVNKANCPMFIVCLITRIDDEHLSLLVIG